MYRPENCRYGDCVDDTGLCEVIKKYIDRDGVCRLACRYTLYLIIKSKGTGESNNVMGLPVTNCIGGAHIIDRKCSKKQEKAQGKLEAGGEGGPSFRCTKECELRSKFN